MVQLASAPETDSPRLSIPLATTTLDVQGMKCAGCVSAVGRQLQQQLGGTAAQVNLVTAVAVVQCYPSEIEPQTLAEELSKRGFPSQLRPTR